MPINSNKLKEIPLFPLNVNLLPEGFMPLQIFEPRYIDMVKLCMSDNLGFVVVLDKYEVGERNKERGHAARALSGDGARAAAPEPPCRVGRAGEACPAARGGNDAAGDEAAARAASTALPWRPQNLLAPLRSRHRHAQCRSPLRMRP